MTKGRIVTGSKVKGHKKTGQIIVAKSPAFRSSVYTDDLDRVSTNLTLMGTKAKHPSPVFKKIAELFSYMEMIRFVNQGAAPEFGITESWKDLEKGTLENRRYLGTANTQPLVAFGFLMNAATHPIYETFGTKSINLAIDVTKSSPTPPNTYSHGYNYADVHHNSEDYNFVNITPKFRLEAAKLVQSWIMNSTPYEMENAMKNKKAAKVLRSSVSKARNQRHKQTGGRFSRLSESEVKRRERIRWEQSERKWAAKTQGPKKTNSSRAPVPDRAFKPSSATNPEHSFGTWYQSIGKGSASEGASVYKSVKSGTNKTKSNATYVKQFEKGDPHLRTR